MMRIGIFGGTFDPIHNGHLRVAEEVREDFALDRVYFVPVLVPPHKREKSIAGAADRLELVRAAVRGNRHLRASDRELRRGGVSYSIDTVREFAKASREIFFVIGIDAFAEINTWHRFEDLFFHANFIVMTRELKGPFGASLLPKGVREKVRAVDGGSLEHLSGRRIHFHEVTRLDISSTKIRDLVRRGRSVRYLVPPGVERRIAEKGLYGE